MSVITHIDYGMPTYADPEIITFSTAASAATAAAIPHGTTVELHATEDCYLAFGAAAPTAASTTHKLTKDFHLRYTMHGDTFIAARGAINSGALTISILVTAGGK
jgi:hypothetical protein